MPITGKTTVVGLFGDPVAHSLSPQMHNRAFGALGLDWVYVPFHVKAADLAQGVDAIRALGLRGVNVTVPHKAGVMAFLDEVDDEARRVGAVNTIVNRDGRLIGYNTDGQGLVRSLQRQGGRDVAGARVVIVGAGGAAQGIAGSVARAGASSIVIGNRTPNKAETIVAGIKDDVDGEVAAYASDAEAFFDAVAQADIVIQATSLGMHPHHEVPPPPWVKALAPTALVCDIVYNPRETAVVQAARERGCTVVTGEGMLAYQGAVAFELWTGRQAPDQLMLETLQQLLAERS